MTDAVRRSNSSHDGIGRELLRQILPKPRARRASIRSSDQILIADQAQLNDSIAARFFTGLSENEDDEPRQHSEGADEHGRPDFRCWTTFTYASTCQTEAVWSQ